jgi:hypothetical protein
MRGWIVAGLGATALALAACAQAAPLTIAATTTVPQPPEKVWALLTDFPSYPGWNRFITKASGNLVAGDKITIEVHPKSGGVYHVTSKLLVVKPNEELRWIGKLGAGGLFDGEHFWLLKPTPSGGTEFTHGETYHGILVGAVGPQKFKQDFEEMNRDMTEELARRDAAAAPH